jgi:hypothetical protein
MGNTLVAETLIGVCAALIGVVTFRRKMPKALELAAWVVLIGVCIIAISSTRNPQARALTTAAVWGASQIVGTVVELFGQGVLHSMYAARFAIADWVAVLFGVDLLALALVSTKRQANAWIPVTKLGEWMVLPRLSTAEPEHAAVSAVDEINKWFNAWSRVAAASTLTWSTLFIIRLRDVEIPKATRGLRHVALGAGVALRRVAAGRAQVGQVRFSRMEPTSAVAGLLVRRPKRLVAPGRPESNERGTGMSGRTRVSVDGARKTNRRKRQVVVETAPPVMEVVDVDLLGARAKARKVQAGTTPRKPRRRTSPRAPQPRPGKDNNGSEKGHRQGRLAS